MKRNKKIFKILVTSCLTLLLFTGCYSWYESKVNMDSTTPKMNLGDLFYREKEITALEAPKQILVSQGKFNNIIKIHWDEVPFATSYRLERAVVIPDSDGKLSALPDDSAFEALNKHVYSNNYTDVILSSPSSANKEYNYLYYYRVSAENIKMGYESSEYTQTVETSCGWLLSPPSYIEAQKGESSEYIELAWTAVPLANRYLIYRGEKANGLGMEQLDSVMGNINSYKNVLAANEKGVEFYYKVCAQLADGSTSAFTGLALGYSAQEGAPACPASVTVINGKGESTNSLTLSWPAVSKSGYSIKYSVYRTSQEDSIYTLISNNVTGGGATLTFTDSSLLKTGTKYYYYVQTIAQKEGESGELVKSNFTKSGPDSENPAEGWLLSPSSNFEITEATDPSRVVLKWSPAIGYEKQAYSYNVYASSSVDGDYTLLEHDISEASGEISLEQNAYYSYEIEKKPFFKLTTTRELASGELVESIMSNAAAPYPLAPVNVKASKTSALDGLENYSANTNGVYPVMISWEAPENENPYGYYIYRSTNPDSSFRKITDEPVTDGSLRYIDYNETARAGTLYYYKIVSLNELKQGINYNEQTEASRGYGAITRDQWFREYNKTVKKSLAKLTLMHKSGTNALGSESVKGDLSGSLSYNAKMDGLGARILMHYSNYQDFYVGDDKELGPYFILEGDTNTSANMSANGSMDGINRALQTGMYPGYAKYDNLEIKGGGAGGGYYLVTTQDKDGNTVLSEGRVDWTVGEE